MVMWFPTKYVYAAIVTTHKLKQRMRMVVSVHGVGLLLLLFSCCCTVKVESGSSSRSRCPPSVPCGDLGNLMFPYTTTAHRECGVLVVHGCEDDAGARKSIQNNNKWFDIVNISLSQSTITIRDEQLLELLSSRGCEVLGYYNSNKTFSVTTPLASSAVMFPMNLLRCNHTLSPTPSPYVLYNSTVCGNDTIYGVTDPVWGFANLVAELNSSSYNHLRGCSMIQLPLGTPLQNKDLNVLLNSLTADIPIQISLSSNCFHCNSFYGGQCRIDSYGQFYCDRGRDRKMVVKAVAAGAGGLGVLIVLLGWCFRRRFYSKENPTYQIIEAFLKDHGHLAAKRYSYLEIKKATKAFKDKLGKGGYGSVYKGKLPEGTLVAVKVLSESKGNGEEFINEVASISVTSHVNIVQLLGFTLEGSKRALIYKYMPNGSVEKFIYKDKDPLKFNPQLSCRTMYKIAIGVARGLDYLHKGCNSKIVHFDIKPHNILLDEDFCPKISDFGLAKISTKKESILSLLDARGTIGYIAPEVFSRNFGGVSHKSDVYSYGMMVLEMIGGRNNTSIEEEINDESSSETYFPHWVYKRLELHEDLELQCIKSKFDKEIIQKMIIVSLWCIQTDPSNRPTMGKVVDMMESNLEFLQMPPKPYLSSPPRSPSGSSDSSHSNM